VHGDRDEAALVTPGRWLTALLALVFGRRRRKRSEGGSERTVPAGPGTPRAELAVIALLLLAALSAIGFVVFFAIDDLENQTQFLGLSIGLSFAFLAAALIVGANHLIVTEEEEHDYPEEEHPAEQAEVAELVEESGSRITRKGLLATAGGAAGGAIGLALLAPVLSFGPWLKTHVLYRTPWRRGRLLVDRDGRPLRAADITREAFYTAFPQGGDRDDLGAPIVVVRLETSQLELPAARADWAPEGIVAYSKVCTHAGCAIALYRKPTFPPIQPRRALVCPCHYSTFDPARGGKVIFGPAGRPLPQLPLRIDRAGQLRAGGNYSGPVGPSWWGVRSGEASS
jgi:ubiquinol-cytochrome c reductase iron-sulfur subunit